MMDNVIDSFAVGSLKCKTDLQSALSGCGLTDQSN